MAPDSFKLILSSFDIYLEYLVPLDLQLAVSFFYPGDLWTGDVNVHEQTCNVVTTSLVLPL